MKKSLAISAIALAFAASTASAGLVFDLRASAVDSFGTLDDSTGKSVILTPGGSGNVTLQLWAVITNTAAGAGNPFGIQTMFGSVVSQTFVAGMAGSIGPATPSRPFGVGSVAGGGAELSQSFGVGNVADTILDRGSNSTSSVTAYSKFRADPTDVNGTLIGTQYYPTNTTPNGATIHQLPTGYEFLMGQFTLTVTNISPPATANINWQIPLVTSPGNRGPIAAWLDGSVAAGAAAGAKNGNANFGEISIGSPVFLNNIPEPSALGLLLVGAMGLLGFRHLNLRG